MTPWPRAARHARRGALASVAGLLLAIPAAAQLTADESAELARLRTRESDLAGIEARADAGDIALLPDPNRPGWLEAPRGEPATMISSLILTGDLTAEEGAAMARNIGEELRTGRARLDAEIGKVRGRIRVLESRDLAVGGTLASGDREEVWRFAMVGRFDRTGDPMRSTGTLDLEFLGGGRVYGVAHYDSRDSWDDTVEGTIRDGRVRIEYGASNSVTRGIFTGAIDPSGTTARGEYRISGTIDARGTWRATRAPDPATTPAPTARAGVSDPAPPASPSPTAARAAEDSLLNALMPDLRREFQPLVRSGALPLDAGTWKRQRLENRNRAAREIFGRGYDALGEAERALAADYVVAMDLAVLSDRAGARAFPGVAASLPVIEALARNAREDPEAGVALRRYLAMLQRMDVRDLRRRHGVAP